MTKRNDPQFLKAQPGKKVQLKAMGARKGVPHIFEQGDIDVVNSAIATRRPLLLRGEPGMGKSQLARAVAQQTGRAFVSVVVDARTEPYDLRYRFDAVRRLGVAQLQSIRGAATDEDVLAEENFVSPGPLWWAFDPVTAADQAVDKRVMHPWQPDEFNPKRHGTVVLIDEIDKADASVPNGLLEALGDRQFPVLGRKDPIVQIGPPPLIVITTNEERTLPPAFLRRCWVYQMRPREPINRWLKERGRAHFPNRRVVSEAVLDEAVRQLVQDRTDLGARQLSLPGQAELIDLLGALRDYGPEELQHPRDEYDNDGQYYEDLKEAQLALLKRINSYVFQKHPKGRANG